MPSAVPNSCSLMTSPIPCPARARLWWDIRAAGINPADTYMRTGTYAIVPDLPYIPGGDAGGVVAAVGDGVGGFPAR